MSVAAPVTARLRFNSRTPGGVRQGGLACKRPVRGVSIHAPREGCDLTLAAVFVVPTGFNSRTPGGVRLVLHRGEDEVQRFNSRTPGGVRQYGAKLPIMGRINKRNLRLAVLL